MSSNLKTREEINRVIKARDIQTIELRFTDLPGQWQYLTIPAGGFDAERLGHGMKFDGPSIPWFNERKMLVLSDPVSAFIDPFTKVPKMLLICNIGKNSTRDPRYIAQKAEAYLQKLQIGDTANFGLELEYFVVNKERNEASEGGPGLPIPPAPGLPDIGTQVVATLGRTGIRVDTKAENPATDGQGKIDLPFCSLTRMADNVMISKYVIENVARKHGVEACFMPKSLIKCDDSVMHVRQSIWQGERPLFAGDGYAGSSALMRHYIAGLVEHAPALLAVSDPGPKHLRRRRIRLSHERRNVSSVSGIPIYPADPNAKGVEFCCNPSCNPYLAFAAMLMAGIDGFENRFYSFNPREPLDKFCDVPPISFEESLDALEVDHAFLRKGDVFTLDVIESYLQILLNEAH